MSSPRLSCGGRSFLQPAIAIVLASTFLVLVFTPSRASCELPRLLCGKPNPSRTPSLPCCHPSGWVTHVSVSASVQISSFPRPRPRLLSGSARHGGPGVLRTKQAIGICERQTERKKIPSDSTSTFVIAMLCRAACDLGHFFLHTQRAFFFSERDRALTWPAYVLSWIVDGG